MARFNQMINASISVKVCLSCNTTDDCLIWCSPLPSPPNDTAFLYPPPGKNSSNPSLSPLVIIVVGVLASLFLLVSYYAIIVKFCSSWDLGRNPRRSNNNNNDDDDDDEMEENHQNHPLNQFWHVRTVGLDDSIINSIAVCKYKKDEGLIDGTECTVCLSEFHEEENLRLLPKCSHAFHLPCIDTWLRSHVNCPLCRANIVSNPPPDSSSDQTVSTDPIESDEPPGNHHLGSGNDDRRLSPTTQVAANVNGEETEDNSFEGKGKCSSSLARERVHSDLAVHETMIDVTMDDEMVQPQPVRRSFSMDESSSSSMVRLALADLHHHRTSSSTAQESPIIGAKSSKFSFGEFSGLKAIILKKHHHAKFKQSGSNNSIVQGPSLPVSLGKGSGPIDMKRSFSSSNFLYGCSRSRNSVLPL